MKDGLLVAFDLETILKPELIELLPEVAVKEKEKLRGLLALPEPRANPSLVDPAKIKVSLDTNTLKHNTAIANQKLKIKDIEDKQIHDMGKNPHLNVICCASFQDVFEPSRKKTLMLNPDTMDEKELLKDIWNTLAKFQQFVTFNGMAFDVECLNFHSMVHQVKRSVDIGQNKYRVDNHVDIRMVLGRGNDYAKGTQDFFSRIILGEVQQDAEGSQIQWMWDRGKYDEIAAKCEDDVDKLARIYTKLDGYYGF